MAMSYVLYSNFVNFILSEVEWKDFNLEKEQKKSNTPSRFSPRIYNIYLC